LQDTDHEQPNLPVVTDDLSLEESPPEASQKAPNLDGATVEDENHAVPQPSPVCAANEDDEEEAEERRSHPRADRFENTRLMNSVTTTQGGEYQPHKGNIGLYNSRAQDRRENGDWVLALPSTLHTFALIHPLLFCYGPKNATRDNRWEWWLPTVGSWIGLLATFAIQLVFSIYLWEVGILFDGCRVAEAWKGSGEWLRISCLSAFLLSVGNDLVESITMAQFFYHIPTWCGDPTQSKQEQEKYITKVCQRWNTYLIMESRTVMATNANGRSEGIPVNYISKGGVTRHYRFLMHLVLLFKVMQEVFLAIFGSRFLLKEGIPVEMILNTVGLQFINSIDDILYTCMVGQPIRRNLEAFPPLRLLISKNSSTSSTTRSSMDASNTIRMGDSSRFDHSSTDRTTLSDRKWTRNKRVSLRTSLAGIEDVADDTTGLVPRPNRFDLWWNRWQMPTTMCLALVAVFASFHGWCHEVAKEPSTSFCKASPFDLVNGKQQTAATCSEVMAGELPRIDRIPSAVILSPVDKEVIQAGTSFRVQVKMSNFACGCASDSSTRWLAEPQRLSHDGLVEGHLHVVVQRVDELLDMTEFEFFQSVVDKQDLNGILTVDLTDDNVIQEPGHYRVCAMLGTCVHATIQLPREEQFAIDDCIRISVQEGPDTDQTQRCPTSSELQLSEQQIDTAFESRTPPSTFCNSSKALLGEIPSGINMPASSVLQPINGQSISAGTPFTIRVGVKNFAVIDWDYTVENNEEFPPLDVLQKLDNHGWIQGHAFVLVQELMVDSGGRHSSIPSVSNYTFVGKLTAVDHSDNGSVVLAADVDDLTFLMPGTFRLCTVLVTAGHSSINFPIAKRGFHNDCTRFSVE